MNKEIERLAKLIIKQENELNNFDQKKFGSSAREDLHGQIDRLKERLAKMVLSLYK